MNLVLVAAETGISKQDFDNLLGFEKELFDDLMKSIDISDKKLTQNLNGGEKEEEKKNKLVIFKEKGIYTKEMDKILTG